MKKLIELIKISVADFNENDVMTKAAAIAYYTIFSLPPMLLVVLYTATLFYNRSEVEEAIFGQIGDLAGQDSARQLLNAIENLGVFEGEWWAQVVGIGVLIFTATTIFTVMQSALNKVFHVKPKSKQGWGILSLIKDRILSFSLVLGVAFILIVSLSLNAAIGLFGQFLAKKIPLISEIALSITSNAISLAVTTFLFGLIFKFLPDVRLKWKDTWRGAFITAVLFAVGKFAIGYYIGNSNTANLYDTAGSVMVLMLWVYYASVIFLFGAILTSAYTEVYNDRPPEAAEHAVKYEKILKEVEV